MNIHPSYEKILLPWLFQIQPNDMWKNTKTQQDFIEWIEKELMISSMEQWYDVKKYDIEERGTSLLISN